MYVGYMLFVDPEWLDEASRKNFAGRRSYMTNLVLPESMDAGDPVFLGRYGELEPSIELHGRVTYCKRAMFKDCWRAAGQLFGLPPEKVFAHPGGGVIPPWTSESPVAALILQDVSPVFPPIRLKSIDICRRGDALVQELSPEDVLVLLRGLPRNSQTAWTKRVVARNNDLPS
jgi:hypothetical protein